MLSTRKLKFLTVLEDGKAKIKVLEGLVSDENLRPDSYASSCCILPRQLGYGALWSIYNKGTNPVHERSTLMTHHLPKALKLETGGPQAE